MTRPRRSITDGEITKVQEDYDSAKGRAKRILDAIYKKHEENVGGLGWTRLEDNDKNIEKRLFSELCHIARKNTANKEKGLTKIEKKIKDEKKKFDELSEKINKLSEKIDSKKQDNISKKSELELKRYQQCNKRFELIEQMAKLAGYEYIPVISSPIHKNADQVIFTDASPITSPSPPPAARQAAGDQASNSDSFSKESPYQKVIIPDPKDREYGAMLDPTEGKDPAESPYGILPSAYFKAGEVNPKHQNVALQYEIKELQKRIHSYFKSPYRDQIPEKYKAIISNANAKTYQGRSNDTKVELESKNQKLEALKNELESLQNTLKNIITSRRQGRGAHNPKKESPYGNIPNSPNIRTRDEVIAENGNLFKQLETLVDHDMKNERKIKDPKVLKATSKFLKAAGNDKPSDIELKNTALEKRIKKIEEALRPTNNTPPKPGNRTL